MTTMTPATTSPTIDCKVICDLMIVYASGEASPETVATIEAHLDACPECREAYDAAQRGEDLLSGLEPVVRPIHIDGRKILVRVQRLVFGALSAMLLLAALAIALAERWIARDLLGLPLTQLYTLPGGWESIATSAALTVLYGLLYRWRTRFDHEADRPYFALIGMVLLFGLGLAAFSFMVRAGVVGVLTAGTLLFVLFIFILRFRARQSSGRFSTEFLLSLEAVIPLLFLILAALTITSSESFPASAIAIGLMVLALFFTLLRLDELPYMTVLSLAALFTGGLMLVGNAFGGVVRIFDLTLDWPAELGHPAGYLAEAPEFDLSGLGYTQSQSTPVSAVGRRALTAGTVGYVSEFTGQSGREIRIFTLRFTDQDAAEEFFSIWWRDVNDGFHAIRLDLSDAGFNEPEGFSESPLHWWLELPGAWFGQEGALIRAYDETTMTAVNAWQIDEWVTIVEVDGIATQALAVSREVKEVVAEAYGP